MLVLRVFNAAVTLSSGPTLRVSITVAIARLAGATGQNRTCGPKRIDAARCEDRKSDALRAVRLAVRAVGSSSMA